MTTPAEGPATVTHRCPLGDDGIMPCCRRTPFEVPRTDRMTEDDAAVTCVEGPATVTPDPTACQCAFPDDPACPVHGEGPATVTPHEFLWHPSSVAEQLAGRSASGSASCSCGDWRAVVLDNRAGNASAKLDHREHVVRALTADLAAAHDETRQRTHQAVVWQRRARERGQVIANVRALADEWQDAIDGRTANPGGWGQRLRALLPAAPTEEAHRIVAEAPQAGAARRYTCACGEQIIAHPDVLAEAFAVHLSAAPTGEGT